MIKQKSYSHIKFNSKPTVAKGSHPVTKKNQSEVNLIKKRNSKSYIGEKGMSSKNEKDDKKGRQVKGNYENNRNIKQYFQKIDSKYLQSYQKNQIKNLVDKMCNNKINREMVPQIIRHIELSCKMLRNLHNHDKGMNSKRCSYQESKQVSQQKQNHRASENNKNNHSEDKMKPEKPHQKKHIKDKLKKNLKSTADDQNNSKNKESITDSKNFLELFKSYKKEFDLDGYEIVEKRQSNDKLKNSQMSLSNSKNSAFTKERKSCVGHKQSDKASIEIMRKLMKNKKQISSKDKLHLNKEKKNQVRKNESKQNKKSKSKNKESKKKVKQTIIIEPQSKPTFQQSTKLEDNFHKVTLGEEIKQDEISPHQSFAGKKANESQQKALQNTQKVKFQASKFYVQPVPLLIPKKTDHKSKIQQMDKSFKGHTDNSLLGCEITLIQDEFVAEDWKMMQFQL